MSIVTQQSRRISRIRDNRSRQCDVPPRVINHGCIGRPSRYSYLGDEARDYIEQRIATLRQRDEANQARKKCGLPMVDLIPSGEEWDFEAFHQPWPTLTILDNDFAPAPVPSHDELEAGSWTNDALLANGAGFQSNDPFEDD